MKRVALILSLALGGVAAAALARPALAQTASVVARGETVPVGTANADAADDPAIWRNPRDPAQSLIVATDKKAGLHIYGLDGVSRHFVPAGRVNNVDLVDMGGKGVIVVASDRNDEASAKLLVYRLDTRQARLELLGSVTGGAGEAYGVCLMRKGQAIHAFSVLKNGHVHQVRIQLGKSAPSAAIVRTMTLATQTEGCVVDPRTKTLFVGEEDRGIWAFDAREAASTQGRLVAPVDGGQLVADVEGLALAPKGRKGGWLVASSQGDNAYALYRLPGMQPAGRFRIGTGRLGSVEETDGIALALGGFGKEFAGGLFVAQDGENEPAPQNFKLVAWADVVAALGLKKGR
jgi:3-phytase